MDKRASKAKGMNRGDKPADKEKLKTETPNDIQEEKAAKLEAHQPPPVNTPTRPSNRDHGRRFKGPDLDASPETI